MAPAVASWTSDDAACAGQSLTCVPREGMDESRLESVVNSDDNAKNGIQKKSIWWRGQVTEQMTEEPLQVAWSSLYGEAGWSASEKLHAFGEFFSYAASAPCSMIEKYHS